MSDMEILVCNLFEQYSTFTLEEKKELKDKNQQTSLYLWWESWFPVERRKRCRWPASSWKVQRWRINSNSPSAPRPTSTVNKLHEILHQNSKAHENKRQQKHWLSKTHYKFVRIVIRNMEMKYNRSYLCDVERGRVAVVQAQSVERSSRVHNVLSHVIPQEGAVFWCVAVPEDLANKQMINTLLNTPD